MNFQNKDLDIFKKGDYQPINRDFISEASHAMIPLATIQHKYKKLDNDSFFNELKDGMVASYLNFDLVNTKKHGLDAKSSTQNTYLEVKQASFSASSWGGLMIPPTKKPKYLKIKSYF